MNYRKPWVVLVAATSLGAAGFGVHHLAQAQQEPPTAPPPGGAFGGRARFGGGGPAQMVVAGTSLFILRGNTLYRVNTSSLAVEAKADLPVDTSPAAQAGSNFRGGGRFRNRNAAPGADNAPNPGP